MKFSWLKKANVHILIIGHTLFHFYYNFFDYILYPIIVYKYGPLYGGISLAILDGLTCLLILYVYDLLENDWLGIESAKALMENFFKEEEDVAKKSWRKHSKNIAKWLFHRNKIGQLIFLSTYFNALITIIYMRPGYHLYNGLSKRDWRIFFGSIIISNAWWASLSFVVIAVVRDFLKLLIY